MQHNRPDFPAMEQVEQADHEQLARWYTLLLRQATQKNVLKILDRIAERFKKLGGMTPAIEKEDRFLNALLLPPMLPLFWYLWILGASRSQCPCG